MVTSAADTSAVAAWLSGATSGGTDPLYAALLAKSAATQASTAATASVGNQITFVNLIKELNLLLGQQGYGSDTQNAIDSYVQAAAKALAPGSNINVTV